jgi:hypothetical protein
MHLPKAYFMLLLISKSLKALAHEFYLLPSAKGHPLLLCRVSKATSFYPIKEQTPYVDKDACIYIVSLRIAISHLCLHYHQDK